LEVDVTSWKLAWLGFKHRLGFPKVIDDIPKYDSFVAVKAVVC